MRVDFQSFESYRGSMSRGNSSLKFLGKQLRIAQPVSSCLERGAFIALPFVFVFEHRGYMGQQLFAHLALLLV